MFKLQAREALRQCTCSIGHAPYREARRVRRVRRVRGVRRARRVRRVRRGRMRMAKAHSGLMHHTVNRPTPKCQSHTGRPLRCSGSSLW